MTTSRTSLLLCMLCLALATSCSQKRAALPYYDSLRPDAADPAWAEAVASGKLADAREQLQAAASATDAGPDLLMFFGDLSWATGDREGAVAAYQRALAGLEPGVLGPAPVYRALAVDAEARGDEVQAALYRSSARLLAPADVEANQLVAGAPVEGADVELDREEIRRFEGLLHRAITLQIVALSLGGGWFPTDEPGREILDRFVPYAIDRGTIRLPDHEAREAMLGRRIHAALCYSLAQEDDIPPSLLALATSPSTHVNASIGSEETEVRLLYGESGQRSVSTRLETELGAYLREVEAWLELRAARPLRTSREDDDEPCFSYTQSGAGALETLVMVGLAGFDHVWEEERWISDLSENMDWSSPRSRRNGGLAGIPLVVATRDVAPQCAFRDARPHERPFRGGQVSRDEHGVVKDMNADSAAELLEACLQVEQDDPDYWYYPYVRGTALYHLARHDEAMAAYDRASELATHEASQDEIRVARAWSFGTSGEVQALRLLVEEALASGAGGMAPLLGAVEKAGEGTIPPVELIGWYRLAAKQEPEKAGALRLDAAKLAIEAGSEGAEDDLRAALNSADQSTRNAASRLLVTFLIDSGRPEEAIAEVDARGKRRDLRSHDMKRASLDLARQLSETGHPGLAAGVCLDLMRMRTVTDLRRKELGVCLRLAEQGGQAEQAEQLLWDRLVGGDRPCGSRCDDIVGGLSDWAAGQGDHGAAIKLWRDHGPMVRQRNPAGVHREVASLLLDAGDHSEAVREAQRAVEAGGGVREQLLAAECMARSGQATKSVEALAGALVHEDARRYRRELDEALTTTADLCVDSLGWDTCAKILDEAGQGDSGGRCCLGKAVVDSLLEQREDDRAFEVFLTLEGACDPGLLKPQTMLDSLVRMGRYDKAHDLAMGLDELPRVIDLAAWLRVQGQVEEGHALLERYAAEKPTDRHRVNELARYRELTGDQEGARNAIRQLLEMDPTDASTLSRLASVHRVAGAHPAVLALYEQTLAADLTPRKRVEIELAHARALHQAGRTDEAVAECLGLIDEMAGLPAGTAPDYLLHGAIDTLVSLGREDEAIEAWRNAEWLDLGRRKLIGARILSQTKHEDEALQLLRELPGEHPGDAELAQDGARAALRAGSAEVAEHVLREALERNPSHDKTRKQLVKLLVDLDRGTDAAAVVAAGCELLPAFLIADPSYHGLLVDAGRGEDAAQWRDAIDAEQLKSKQRLSLVGLVAREHAEAGRVTDATAAYEALMEGSKQDKSPTLACARTLRAAGAVDEAEVWFRKVTPAYASDVADLLDLLTSSGRMADAEALVEDLSFTKPTYHAGALEILAADLAGCGHCGEARDRYRAALTLNPHTWDARYHLAYLLAWDGQSEEGEALLREQVERASAWSLNRSQFAGYLADNAETEVAEKELAATCAAFPWESRPHYAHALALSKLSRFEEAAEAMARHVALQPDPGRRARYAIYLERAGDLDEAERQATLALNCNPDSAIALAALATLSLRRGQTEDAIASYLAAFDADPSQTWTVRRVIHLMRRLGKADGQGDLVSRLIEAEREALDRQPCNPAKTLRYAGTLARFDSDQADLALSMTQEIHEERPRRQTHVSMAYVLHYIGRSDEALGHMQEADELEPDPMAGHEYMRARILAAIGREEEAREALARAVELDTDYFERPDVEALVGG